MIFRLEVFGIILDLKYNPIKIHAKLLINCSTFYKCIEIVRHSHSRRSIQWLSCMYAAGVKTHKANMDGKKNIKKHKRKYNLESNFSKYSSYHSMRKFTAHSILCM